MSTNSTLINIINKGCPNCSHSHRQATKDEYTQNKLYKWNDTGCYLCSPNITFDSMYPSLSWICQTPDLDNRFIIKVQHELSVSQKAVILFIFTNIEFNLYLPMELILMIFKQCNWEEKQTAIKSPTLELIAHTITCRFCADKLVAFNTMFTCQHHMIPRTSLDQ
jgi:hypothetical protein